MSEKTSLGSVCAYIPPESHQKKGSYKTIGHAMIDENGNISLVLDCIPLPHTGWKGWCNIFNPKGGEF
jgi:hypothetical protein